MAETYCMMRKTYPETAKDAQKNFEAAIIKSLF